MLIDFEWFYAIPFFLIYIFVTWKHSMSWLYRAIHLTYLSYMIILFKQTFFPVVIRPPEYVMPIGKNNFVPFQSIQEIISHSVPGVALVQIGGNLLMHVPMGFYLSLSWKKIDTLGPKR
ncbi:VanZ family protein [Staphylospora marina]|uniref:VanZ family protein n=1 Tax=Staphylospora marina TaxID=2490858 RepID=UPI000F5C00C2|nr:VanZ family protein [Staphylospora marina]